MAASPGEAFRKRKADENQSLFERYNEVQLVFPLTNMQSVLLDAERIVLLGEADFTHAAALENFLVEKELVVSFGSAEEQARTRIAGDVVCWHTKPMFMRSAIDCDTTEPR